jgi:pyruvate kinase
VRGEGIEEPGDATELLDLCSEAAKRAGLAEPGDRIGITAGLPPGRSGGTNLFKVHKVT